MLGLAFPSMNMTYGLAASIGIIGGADGPTAILTTTKLATDYLAPIAVAAYSYMALVPVIQPPIMKALTTKEERCIKMEQLRPVSQREKILFPIVVSILVILILPDTAPLIGMLMFGNLLKECLVTKQLAETASNALMYIITIMLGTAVGASAQAETFLTFQTLGILLLGVVAFMVSTAAGVLFGKVMCKATHGKVNPLDRSGGRVGGAHGGPCRTEGRQPGGPHQFPAHARDGTQRGWSHRFRHCRRRIPEVLWLRRINKEDNRIWLKI